MSDDSGSGTLAGDSGPTALDNSGTGNAIAGVVARQSDAGATGGIGRIGGGRTGTTGPGAGGELAGASEPTDTGNETGLGSVGSGTGRESITPTLTTGDTLTGTDGIGGTRLGGTGTGAGGSIGARSGGTGDIGGLGGTTVGDDSSGGGTSAIGGVAGGIGTSDEGELGPG